jgi:hypothetical protein
MLDTNTGKFETPTFTVLKAELTNANDNGKYTLLLIADIGGDAEHESFVNGLTTYEADHQGNDPMTYNLKDGTEVTHSVVNPRFQRDRETGVSSIEEGKKVIKITSKDRPTVTEKKGEDFVLARDINLAFGTQVTVEGSINSWNFEGKGKGITLEMKQVNILARPSKKDEVATAS